MQCGRATVVSGTGTYLDVPAHRVVHVSAGRLDPEELVAAFGRLLDDPDLRARIGGAAREHMVWLATSEATVRGSEEAIDGTLALVQDPRGGRWWAGALVDIAVRGRPNLG
jgi:hypothetical protein